MSFFRSFLLVCLISFAAAFGLLILGSLMGYEEFRGGYAVLSVDASVDDAAVVSLLQSGDNNFGGTPVSESSQWVFLDEFDSINKIPLAQYPARILPFDPRNDGYAGKLKQLFLKDEKRLFYIPLQAGNWDVNLLDKQLSSLLGDIYFSVDYYGVGRPLYLFFIAYAAASFCFFIICLIRKKQSGKIACIITLIPVLSSFAFFGAHGIACAAVFLAFFILLRDLLTELSILPASGKIYKKYFLPYRLYWFFLLLFPPVFYILIYFSQIKLFFFISAGAAAFLVFFLSLKIMSVSRKEHKRFTPVLIMRKRSPEFVLPFYILPFAAAAVFVLFAAPYMTAVYDSEKKFDAFITEKDYYDHINFQASFSVRQINDPNVSAGAFPEFFFDADGLPSILSAANITVNMNDFPPFPLRNLMDFFNDVNSRNKTSSIGSSGTIAGKLSLLVLLLFILPGLFIRRNNDQASKIKLNKIKIQAGGSGLKSRNKGINWNKKTMYNGKSHLSIQKDA